MNLCKNCKDIFDVFNKEFRQNNSEARFREAKCHAGNIYTYLYCLERCKSQATDAHDILLSCLQRYAIKLNKFLEYEKWNYRSDIDYYGPAGSPHAFIEGNKEYIDNDLWKKGL